MRIWSVTAGLAALICLIAIVGPVDGTTTPRDAAPSAYERAHPTAAPPWPATGAIGASGRQQPAAGELGAARESARHDSAR